MHIMVQECVEELKFNASVELCEMDAFQTMLMVSCKDLSNLVISPSHFPCLHTYIHTHIHTHICIHVRNYCLASCAFYHMLLLPCEDFLRLTCHVQVSSFLRKQSHIEFRSRDTVHKDTYDKVVDKRVCGLCAGGVLLGHSSSVFHKCQCWI
jgi:hypothetical protein